MILAFLFQNIWTALYPFTFTHLMSPETYLSLTTVQIKFDFVLIRPRLNNEQQIMFSCSKIKRITIFLNTCKFKICFQLYNPACPWNLMSLLVLFDLLDNTPSCLYLSSNFLSHLNSQNIICLFRMSLFGIMHSFTIPKKHMVY